MYIQWRIDLYLYLIFNMKFLYAIYSFDVYQLILYIWWMQKQTIQKTQGLLFSQILGEVSGSETILMFNLIMILSYILAFNQFPEIWNSFV